MKTLYTALLSLVISASSYAQGVINNNADVPPPPIALNSTNATDIWITSTSSNGVNDQRLRVGGSGNNYYSLIRFNVSLVPANATSVKLVLFCYGNEGGRNVGMSLDVLTSPWDNSTGWYTPAPSFAFLKTLVAPVFGWYEIDITQVVQQWKSGSIPNYGIQLRPNGNSRQFNDFYSTDAASGYRPGLAVNTSTGIPAVKYSLYLPLPSLHKFSVQISSDFGSWQNASCGETKLLHTGIDLPALLGTEVRAAEYGTVRLVTKDEKLGGTVVIEHNGPDGVFTTTYGHLDPLKKNDAGNDEGKTAPKEENLKEGDFVQPGDLIGRIVSGSEPFLHFQLREAGYTDPITIRDRLPEAQPCGGDPAFPELFYDPKKVSWHWPLW